MRLASKGGTSFVEKQRFRLFRAGKRIRQFIRYQPGHPKKILFIVGCQRSGTSMIHHLFRQDWDTVTFDEMSPLSLEDPGHFRWDSIADVRTRIMSSRAPLIVAKPLVESQNLRTILAAFPEAAAIWMYRQYRDVVRSNLRYFGDDTGHRDLAPILAEDQSNWRGQNLSREASESIRRVYSPDLSGHDAAALFWYARNSLFFSQGLQNEPTVTTCCYDDLVREPARIMSCAYQILDKPYPGDRIVADVFDRSVGKGKELLLSPDVESLCEDMLDRLESLPRLGTP